jgi:hypothetical protein
MHLVIRDPVFSCQIKSSDPLLVAGTANVEMRKKMEKMLREVQDHVCRSVEEVDGVGKFQRDVWSREDGGGGVSAVMGGGKVPSPDTIPSLHSWPTFLPVHTRVQVWEKAGCNLAVVHGTMPVEALFAANDRLKTTGGAPKRVDYKPGAPPRRRRRRSLESLPLPRRRFTF